MIPVRVVSYLQDEVAIKAEGLKVGMKVIVKGNERVFPDMPVMEKVN